VVSKLRSPAVIVDIFFLAGPIPDFSKCVALKELDLSVNMLTGKSTQRPPANVPDGYPTPFAGAIPDFSKYVVLEDLDLRGNYLSGRPTTTISHRT
jgi:hypothetical protein